MTDPDLQKKNPANPEQASEPVVSKPYIMPDDPEEGSVEALTKEIAEARDKTLRTLAESPDLPAMLQAIADAAVPSLADWASVNMVDGAGEIRTLAIAHRDPEKVRQGWYLNERWPAGWAWRSTTRCSRRSSRPPSNSWT